ncbi:hypothetical protein BGZ93_001298 [Podila epicladia]|nr:hypothetical protein BGZ93_001298 [Podila epicladia]
MIHRPILQQMLDHSLALMMLTLEIHQQQDIELLPGAVHSLAPAQSSEVTTLTTEWRATNFDLAQWTVEFQLEEKLGLQMAAKRRHEILQQQEFPHSSSVPSSPSPNSGLCSPGSSNPPQKRAHMTPEDIEYMIWKARSRPRTSSEGAAGSVGYGAGASEEEVMQSLLMEDTPQEAFDNNFFHCNGSDFPPSLASASVSFKANRNSPAPWVTQRIELGPHSSSDSESSLSRPESPKTICALERIAAFQQNRVLQRSLTKMACRNELSKTELLPMPVVLETSDLGQKRSQIFTGNAIVITAVIIFWLCGLALLFQPTDSPFHLQLQGSSPFLACDRAGCRSADISESVFDRSGKQQLLMPDWTGSYSYPQDQFLGVHDIWQGFFFISVFSDNGLVW